MGEVAASGGYHISAPAPTDHRQPEHLTGSIGDQPVPQRRRIDGESGVDFAVTSGLRGTSALRTEMTAPNAAMAVMVDEIYDDLFRWWPGRGLPRTVEIADGWSTPAGGARPGLTDVGLRRRRYCQGRRAGRHRVASPRGRVHCPARSSTCSAMPCSDAAAQPSRDRVWIATQR
jgi:hypothetical protein